LPKAASSTTAGIVLRISHNVASRNKAAPCPTFYRHTTKINETRAKLGERDRARSFLFSTVRDPAKRAISRAFFSLSRKGIYTNKGLFSKCTKCTDDMVLHRLNSSNHQDGAVSPGQGGFALAYLGMNLPDVYSVWDPEQPGKIKNPATVHETVRSIMDDYDFFLMVERYDESLVAMQLMLDLQPSDILYLPSKTAGSYLFENNKCVLIQKSNISPGIANYFASNEWYAKEYGDYLLQEAVNQSLDLTINALGAEKFNIALQKFQALKAKATEQCSTSAHYPCSKKGMPQKSKAEESCYWKDAGCGYPCLDMLDLDNL
jgi:hypothetical protein